MGRLVGLRQRRVVRPGIPVTAKRDVVRFMWPGSERARDGFQTVPPYPKPCSVPPKKLFAPFGMIAVMSKD
jgi:hypothetical protein